MGLGPPLDGGAVVRDPVWRHHRVQHDLLPWHRGESCVVNRSQATRHAMVNNDKVGSTMGNIQAATRPLTEPSRKQFSLLRPAVLSAYALTCTLGHACRTASKAQLDQRLRHATQVHRCSGRKGLGSVGAPVSEGPEAGRGCLPAAAAAAGGGPEAPEVPAPPAAAPSPGTHCAPVHTAPHSSTQYSIQNILKGTLHDAGCALPLCFGKSRACWTSDQ